MPAHREPDESEVAEAVDVAAGSLVSLWDAAREEATTRLSASQLRALLAIEAAPMINLRGLAQHLGMLLSSASRLVDRLVAAGLVVREPGQADRREIALRLSDAGAALLEDMRRDRQQRLGEVLSRMSREGRRALVRGLSEFQRRQAESAAGGQAPVDESGSAAGLRLCLEFNTGI